VNCGSSTESSFFSELLKSVKGLQHLTIYQNPSEHTPFEKVKTICPKLIKETEALSKSSSSAPPELDRGLVIAKWKQYKTDSTSSSLSVRDCKRYCWVPEIVADSQFKDLVVEQKIPITLPSLRGLLYCYHERFSSLSKDYGFSSRLRGLIASRSSANGAVSKWHNSIDSLIGEKAPKNFAKDAGVEWGLPEKRLEDFGLNPTTEFAQRFASELALLAADRFDSIKQNQLDKIIKGILCSNLVDREDYKSAIATIILSNKANDDEEIQSVLIDFFLRNQGLGDPRINPENWAGIKETAKSRVIQWLSREDINFFFELLLRDRDDKHGRKSFWLQYVDKVSRSRALISRDDLRHHSVRLQEMEDKGRSYGELVGSNTSSAFVLDFGRIVVVEFSEVGNACYIYEKEAFSELYKNFWAKEFPFRHLKNKSLVAERITHSMKDWQSSARHILSRFGVRRG
jgi:hypothetical protein